MFTIVMHHYVVNSGLIDQIMAQSNFGFKDYFLLLFGWGGKTGIDCFVLITGYFMCTTDISLKNYIKLFCEVEFYKILLCIMFTVTGYSAISFKGIAKVIFPFFYVKDGFVSCFLLFYLFIPFINKLIHSLKEKEHLKLMALCLFVYTFLPTFMKADVTFNYITWFTVIYIVSSYIRLYGKEWMNNTKRMGILSTVMIALSWCSIIFIIIIDSKTGLELWPYFFVSDSNKFLALATAVCLFLFFKSLNMKYSKVINTIAASTFGVLLIHANSDTMRQWLWRDTMQNVSYYDSGYIVLHAIIVVTVVYVSCTVIDQIRINLLEKPFMKFVDNKIKR